MFAESVELAAVEAYKAGAPLLSAEVLPVAELFLGHHHGARRRVRRPRRRCRHRQAQRRPARGLAPTIAGLEDEAGVLAFAKAVEDQAAVTYAFALTVLRARRRHPARPPSSPSKRPTPPHSPSHSVSTPRVSSRSGRSPRPTSPRASTRPTTRSHDPTDRREDPHRGLQPRRAPPPAPRRRRPEHRGHAPLARGARAGLLR